MVALSPASKAAIARLRSFVAPPTQYYHLPLTRRAAVLILLFADPKGDLRVVLTIRSSKLRNYAGQAALPGGKADALSETPWHTARREAFEEIGLPMSDDKLPPGYSVEHLTELPANLAMTELGVRPCVAWLRHKRQRALVDDQSLVDESSTQDDDLNGSSPRDPDPARDLLPKLDAKEVAAVFTAPFANFLSALDLEPADRDGVPGTWYKGAWHSWHEEPWRMHQFFVPTVRKGSVFRSANAENTGLDARVAPCSPKSQTPVLLADQKHKGGEIQKEAADTAARSRPPPRKPAETESDDALAQPRYRVFGMTARILVDAARVAYVREPDFEHNSHFGDEDMIARLMKIGRLSAEKKSGEVLTRDVMMKAKKEGKGAKLS
ncbi:hypothetical protein AAFC00_006997 [Neodothiora populina]|uniref:Nudix hydrolase domain-containing protein n=1 Tax=Neodothiora populina TaxID=2781224 RepID=A0ABR3PBY3_9PEZI